MALTKLANFTRTTRKKITWHDEDCDLIRQVWKDLFRSVVETSRIISDANFSLWSDFDLISKPRHSLYCWSNQPPGSTSCRLWQADIQQTMFSRLLASSESILVGFVRLPVDDSTLFAYSRMAAERQRMMLRIVRTKNGTRCGYWPRLINDSYPMSEASSSHLRSRPVKWNYWLKTDGWHIVFINLQQIGCRPFTPSLLLLLLTTTTTMLLQKLMVVMTLCILWSRCSS